MNLASKVILTDVDGVLLDWEYAFHQWIQRHGYKLDPNVTEYGMHNKYNVQREEMKMLARSFNESAQIGWLSPFRDSVKYVRKLHEEHGFVFHAITSLSTDPYAARARTDNLNRLFGPTVFEKVQCIETSADKDEALEPYRDSGCFWIEDKKENAVTGDRMGLQSILIAHEHNNDCIGILRLPNWRNIYAHVTSHYF